MRFLHYSSDNKVLTRDTFIRPNPESLNDASKCSSFNPCSGVLFLSMENDDGNSDWYNYCLEKNLDNWINKTKSVFEIQLQNPKILVLNDFSDLKMFIENYIEYDKKSRTCITPEKLQESIDYYNNKISMCDDFFESMSEDNKEFLDTPELLNSTISKLEKRHYQLPRIINGDFDNKRKKNTKEFIANIYRLKKKLENDKKKEEELLDNYYKIEPSKIDYIKISKEYDGIYYSKELTRKGKYIYETYDDDIDIETISENIYARFNVKNDRGVEKEIISYLDWLESDTMMIWNIENI